MIISRVLFKSACFILLVKQQKTELMRTEKKKTENSHKDVTCD